MQPSLTGGSATAEDTLWSLHPRQMDGSHRVPFDPYGKVPDVSPFAVAARYKVGLAKGYLKVFSVHSPIVQHGDGSNTFNPNHSKQASVR